MRNGEFLGLFGDVNRFSMGTCVVTADRQLKRGLEDGTLFASDMGNAKTVIVHKPTGKWFVAVGGWGNDRVPTAMLGAVCGDVAGSVYERHNIKHKPDVERLIRPDAHFTDDTVMTCAVAEGLRQGLSQLPVDWLGCPDAEELLCACVRDALIQYGRKYPHAGYGGSFRQWLWSEDPAPYGSWGNGSAMRASFAGWAANTLEEAEKLGEISAKVTHNHPQGIEGAKVVSGCIFLLRAEKSKQDVLKYASQFYDLNFSLDEIRKRYTFDVSCAGSVPQAIQAFLEGDSFGDVIANAISIGGDSDTIAAIAGSIAEAVYPIPQGIRGRVIDRLDEFLQNTIVDAVDFIYGRLR